MLINVNNNKFFSLICLKGTIGKCLFNDRYIKINIVKVSWGARMM